MCAGRFEVAQRNEKQEKMRLTGQEYVQRLASPKVDAKHSQAKLKPKHIVVAWYEDRVGDLLSSLASFAPQNSSVSVISREKPQVKHHKEQQTESIPLQK